MDEDTAPPNRLDSVTTELLTPLVRAAVGDSAAAITEWRAEPVKGDGSPGKRFVCRFHGSAVSRGEAVPWSLFLKVPNPTETALDPWHREPFQREVLLVESGVLDGLPGGMAAPRCLRVTRPPDDEPWMWLEDVGGEPALEWPVDRFGTAGSHFGRMQGAFLAGETLPDVPWLDTDGWLQPRLSHTTRDVPSMLRKLSAHPRTQRLFGSAFGVRLRRLWAERERIWEALGRMPRSLCHGDFNYTNLFARDEATDGPETVAVDWQYAGVRPVGEDIAGLIADSSVVPVRRKAGEPEEFTELVLEAYLAGIREGGWQGDLRRVRFACVARLAFVWSFWLTSGWGGGLLNGPVSDVDSEAQATKLDVYVRIQESLFRLADEARTLLAQVTP